MNLTIRHMKIFATITRFPRYRIIQRGDFYILQGQEWHRKPWKDCTSENKLAATRSQQTAEKWLRWVSDPEGTRAEWEPQPQPLQS